MKINISLKKSKKKLSFILSCCWAASVLITSGNGQTMNVKARSFDKTGSPHEVKLIKDILIKNDFFANNDNLADEKVFLSTENLPDQLLKSEIIKREFRDSGILFLSPAEVERRKINPTGTGFEYYYFKPFKVQKDMIIVTFANVWISNKLTSGSWREYKCKKNKMKWKCELSKISLSMS
jgi:hypothetical protein